LKKTPNRPPRVVAAGVTVIIAQSSNLANFWNSHVRWWRLRIEPLHEGFSIGYWQRYIILVIHSFFRMMNTPVQRLQKPWMQFLFRIQYVKILYVNGFF
jgi:hypothetical protein